MYERTNETFIAFTHHSVKLSLREWVRKNQWGKKISPSPISARYRKEIREAQYKRETRKYCWRNIIIPTALPSIWRGGMCVLSVLVLVAMAP